MSCCICTKEEKGADPKSYYICSTCTGTLGSMNKSEVRSAIDKLYLANKVEKARFVEKLVFGSNNSSAEVPKLVKRTVSIKLNRRRI